LEARFHKPPAKEVPGLEQVQYLLDIECKATFTALPLLRISFIAGTVRNLVLRLPVFLTRFVEPVQLNATAFFERWKVIGGPPREAQLIFPIELTSEGNIDLERNAKVVSGHKLSLLEGIDSNPQNLVAAGVLHTATGKIGILVRVEPNRDARLARITVRTTNDAVSAEVLRLICQPLNKDTTLS